MNDWVEDSTWKGISRDEREWGERASKHTHTNKQTDANIQAGEGGNVNAGFCSIVPPSPPLPGCVRRCT